MWPKYGWNLARKLLEITKLGLKNWPVRTGSETDVGMPSTPNRFRTVPKRSEAHVRMPDT